MFNIQDYYLGVIIPQLSYYQNPQRHRYIGDISFDPFNEIPPIVALTMGEVTLLHKKGENYYDEYYSRYKNELYYKLGETNNLGIILAFAEPFQKYYAEEPVFYNQEDIESDYYKLAEILDKHSYYIAHLKLNKTDAIMTLDDNPIMQVRDDYIKMLYHDNGIVYQKRK